MQMHTCRQLLLALLIGFPLAGCSDREPLGRVYGRVTLSGQPVPAGIVVFSSPEQGVHMTAELTPEGTYELQTAGGFGLPLGSYLIAINAPLAQPPVLGSPNNPPPQAQVDIPPKYQQLETSGLRLTVAAGENPFDIEMQPSR